MNAKKGFGLQWHITNKCDQRCKHCYIYTSSKSIICKELTLKEMMNILQNYMTMCENFEVLPYIFVTGGDPLLYYDIWGYLELLHEENIPFSILGNPFHLNDDTCKKLKELGCQKYQMSLDGLRKTHDEMRKEGSYDCTLEKIKLLKKYEIKSAIMSTVSNKNIDEIPGIIDVVVESKVDSYAFARYCPTDLSDNEIVDADKYRELLDTCWSIFEKYKNNGTYFSLKDHLWIPFLHEKGLFEMVDNSKNYILEGCNCGISHLTILPNGDVYACRRFESKIGNALEEPLMDIFLGEKMNYYRNYEKFVACSDCKYLNYCRGCPAVAYCVYGDFYCQDPQCWIKKR
jgi:radical SAM/SPASM domain protein of ACGX system